MWHRMFQDYRDSEVSIHWIPGRGLSESSNPEKGVILSRGGVFVDLRSQALAYAGMLPLPMA